jgi:hypothetical protein
LHTKSLRGVHPGWRGCLTLELENLGEIPIMLQPLSAVGQLVLLHASALPERPKAKLIPVGLRDAKRVYETTTKGRARDASQELHNAERAAAPPR